MTLLEISWLIVSPFIVWILGFFLIRCYVSLVRMRRKRAYLLYIWHSLFAVFYYLVSLNSPTDAIGYYELAQSTPPPFQFGTNFIIIFVHLLTTSVSLSFLSACLVFNIIGAIGFITFDFLLYSQYYLSSLTVRRIFSFLVFLPSLSFWTSTVGKDSVSFTASILALYSTSFAKVDYKFFFVSVLLMTLVRPHIAFFLIFAFLLGLLFSNWSKITLRGLAWFLISGILGCFVFLSASQYIDLSGGLSYESVSSYI